METRCQYNEIPGMDLHANSTVRSYDIPAKNFVLNAFQRVTGSIYGNALFAQSVASACFLIM